MTRRKIQYGVIPPKSDAEFVANMENVLETYERPYNPNHPLVCMDEQPVQLIKKTRQPIPATEKIDWAIKVAHLLEGRYAECEKIILVCDHLNTHTKGAFFEAFTPDRARALINAPN